MVRKIKIALPYFDLVVLYLSMSNFFFFYSEDFCVEKCYCRNRIRKQTPPDTLMCTDDVSFAHEVSINLYVLVQTAVTNQWNNFVTE